MADISDVQNALMTMIAGLAYPTGTSNPSLIANANNSAFAANIDVGTGWPIPSSLDAALANGDIQVSIFARADESSTVHALRYWRLLSEAVASVILTLSGQTVTVGGSLPLPFVGQNLCIQVQGTDYVYSVQPTDTLTSIATAMASLLAPSVPGTTSSGPLVTLPGNANITAVRSGGIGSWFRELRRIRRTIQVTVWCSTPAQRDSIAKLIDLGLAGINFLSFPDGSSGLLVYQGSVTEDVLQKAKLFRRDLLYKVEYPTIETTPSYQIVSAKVNVTAGADAL